MNKSESKYFHTALLMDEALIQLLGVKPFEYITVKEICEKAGVNRSTFYLHYETVADLLSETMDLIGKRFYERFSATPDKLSGNIQEALLSDLVLINSKYLTPYLSFIKENKAVFRAAYQNPSALRTDQQFASLSEQILVPIMTRFQVPKTQQPYWIKFYIHGCMAVVQEWINRDCKDPIDEIEQIIIACIRPENGQQSRRYGE